MQVVFVSPAWRRFEVTRVALAQRAHLCGVLAGRGLEATCVVVADDDNLDIAQEYGFVGVEQNNDYLGRKFNDGFAHAGLEMDADYVISIGSDDWCHADLFDRLPRDKVPMPEPDDAQPVVVWHEGPEITTGRRMAVVNLETGKVTRCEVPGRSGIIPWVMPRAALEPSGFRPANEKQQRGLDFAIVNGLRVRPHWLFQDPHDFCRVDFKSGVNLNGYEITQRALGSDQEEPDPWAALAEHYPLGLVDLARETSEQMATVAA